MVKFLAVLGFACTLGARISSADEPIAIELGGLRQAKAVLTVTEAEYLVKVRMLPIQCFDAAMNARLNREKARELALQALAKHLTEKRAVEFTVSGVQIEKAGTDGKFYALDMRVPRKGVSVVQEGKKPSMKQGEERVAFTSDLFTRKRDYLDTMGNLMTALASDVQKAEEMEKEPFNLAVAEIKERGLKNLDNLGKEIKSDLLLFSAEQDELNVALEKAKAKMQVQLKEAVKRHTDKEKSP